MPLRRRPCLPSPHRCQIVPLRAPRASPRPLVFLWTRLQLTPCLPSPRHCQMVPLRALKAQARSLARPSARPRSPAQRRTRAAPPRALPRLLGTLVCLWRGLACLRARPRLEPCPLSPRHCQMVPLRAPRSQSSPPTWPLARPRPQALRRARPAPPRALLISLGALALVLPPCPRALRQRMPGLTWGFQEPWLLPVGSACEGSLLCRQRQRQVKSRQPSCRTTASPAIGFQSLSGTKR